MKYTDLEQDIIDEIIQHYEDGIEAVYAIDVIDNCGDTKIYRGALASLVKKSAIDVNTSENGLISVFDNEIRRRCGLSG